MKNTTKNTIYTTASVVTALSVAERGLGFLYRIVLSRLIGAEELGLYQVALSLFGLFLTIGTGGIPITVSRMISKSKAENRPLDEKGAVSAGFSLSLLLTLPVCVILFLFGNKITFLFSDTRTFRVFRILLLGLCFSSLYAVIRGSFWGNKQFLLPSVLEISEESVMVVTGILLLRKISPEGSGAELAAWAVVISYLFSFTASFVCFWLKGGRLSSPERQLKPLFNATLPLTSVRASSSLVNSAVAVLLPAMLMRAGATNAEAMSVFGVVSGMVLPILFIPSTILGSLSLVLVPELSEDFYGNNLSRLQKNLERGLSVSFLIACTLIPFFYAVGDDLGRIAFSNAQAGEMISKSSLILLPMSLTMISTGMLNSMGLEKKTCLFYFVGAAVMLLCILLLPPICGGYAYMIGLGASFSLNAVCNLVLLQKKCPIFQNRWGQVCIHCIFPLLVSLLPLSLLGKLCNLLFSKIMSELFAMLLSALILAVGLGAVYILTGIIPLPNLRKKKQAHKPALSKKKS